MDPFELGNVFQAIPETLPEESFETLAAGDGPFRIERIVSRGHSSDPGFWYDQTTIEWVMVISGKGSLRFADREETVVLGPGDWIKIPAGVKHRVESTSPNEDTIWLAIHWEENR